MHEDTCTRCVALEMEIARLRARVRDLEFWVGVLKKMVGCLFGHIRSIEDFTERVIDEHGAKLKAGNLPRGTYSLYKGYVEIAQRVHAVCKSAHKCLK